MPTLQPDAVDPPVPSGWRQAAVFFLRGSDLEAVPRRVAERAPQVVVDLLLAGPTRTEVVSGLRTALSPQDLTVLSGPDGDGLITVGISREFAGMAGGNQLLAVAQVVWTVTQLPRVDRVCFTLDGAFVEVPTDTGLSDQPVHRADYMSVEPLHDGEATAAPTAAGPAERPGR